MKTLIVLSHPDLEQSIANKNIIRHLQEDVKNIEIRHLEKLYPDFTIDVQAEKNALLSADIIIFQYPFYWYSSPAALKQWIDKVLTFGFAYGAGGDKLKGKHFLLSVTLGGPTESYTPLGYNKFTLDEFIKPIQQTAYLTEMIYHGLIHSNRNVYVEGMLNSKSEIKENAKNHAGQIGVFIETLRKGNTHKIEPFMEKWFEHFDQLEENGFFLQYLSSDLKMKIPDHNEFIGHDGFNKWYTEAKNNFIGLTAHHLSNIEITETSKNFFEITFNVRYVAQTKDGNIDIFLKENWQLVWNTTSDRPLISEYLVTQIK
ncbi:MULTISPECIES: NAD(P)H-dependent oxidoreductase [Flavobacterium]|uniref:NAD(P)H-dependent oxidoreductase n=1 Tax=Flavobacterium TaxID=237 RepID=UPI002115C2F5|nr:MULTISPECIES: NAD(P)H-dependent oxidoreductase [Flavobacterium]UUF12442.1 NAD(P)H-dependent oxidoreductase [Flavobacterium panici]